MVQVSRAWSSSLLQLCTLLEFLVLLRIPRSDLLRRERSNGMHQLAHTWRPNAALVLQFPTFDCFGPDRGAETWQFWQTLNCPLGVSPTSVSSHELHIAIQPRLRIRGCRSSTSDTVFSGVPHHYLCFAPLHRSPSTATLPSALNSTKIGSCCCQAPFSASSSSGPTSFLVRLLPLGYNSVATTLQSQLSTDNNTVFFSHHCGRHKQWSCQYNTHYCHSTTPAW